MIRLFEKKLLKWKELNMKKPLMIVGARQIGKTYTIDKFCKDNFKEYLYFNLEKEEDIKEIFEKTISAEEVLSYLELYVGKKINLDETIFFFDEVQVSERFIMSLKYLNESERNFKIICAGSLLGVKLNRFKSSAPVGKVTILYMYPMNFEEFLLATNNEILLNKIKESYKNMEQLPNFSHKQALELYRKYLCVGGMPEAVKDLVEKELDILQFDTSILSDIVTLYASDMQKYVISKTEAIKIEKVYNNIPTQLSQEKSHFQYNLIEDDARKRKYESAIDWLVSSGMVLLNRKVKNIEIPLKVYADHTFKVFLSDIGILTNVSGVTYSDIMLDRSFQFKGAMAENYVAEQFQSMGISLYYWSSQGTAEIDFLIYNEDGIIPIEVKAASNVKSKSLESYIKKYHPMYAIRLSTKNFGYENNIKSIPLYATFCLQEENKK